MGVSWSPQKWGSFHGVRGGDGNFKRLNRPHAYVDPSAQAQHLAPYNALRGSPGARSYYDGMRARKIGNEAALRQLASRQIGILHGCLKTHTLYDEAIALAHHIPAATRQRNPGMCGSVANAVATRLADG
jgi:hypothetical protein